jgi:peptidoglycan/LPS O-acetylase OafA/YrhL
LSDNQPKSVAALSGSHERFDNIDLLRALAVLTVMLYHYTAHYPLRYLRYENAVFPVPYGFVGVDLFFVISGYCIYMTATRCPGLPQFWARRISRLQPAYMGAILITFVVVATYGLPGRQYIPLAAIYNLIWLNAFEMVPSIDGVYWSLIVELKLYVLFGVLYFSLRGRGDPLLWWTVLCLIGSLILLYDHMVGAGFARSTQQWGTFLFPHSGFFLLGMLLYRWQSTPHWLKALAILVFAWACGLGGRDWTERILFFALFPLCKIVLDWKSLRVPAPIVYIGFISYPLYLLHNNVGLVVIRETARVVPSEYGRIALAVAVSLLRARLVSLTVEHRLRKWLERPIAWFLDLFIGLPARLRALVARPAAKQAEASADASTPG